MPHRRLPSPTLLVTLLLAGCSMPAPSTHELLRKHTEPLPVALEGALEVGAKASFGDTVVVIEKMSTSGPVDLRARSLDDALALIAATSNSVERLAEDVEHAATQVRAGARVAVDDGRGEPVVERQGSVSQRVQKQASSVERGAKAVASAARVVAGAAELATLLGLLLSEPEEPLIFDVAAETGGIPHRASCSTKTGETAFVSPLRSLSCVIVRADRPATITWHLSLHTNRGSTGSYMNHSRGFLRREPAIEGDAVVWVARPDKTTGLFRADLDSMTSFIFDHGGRPLANLSLDMPHRLPKLWLTKAPVDGEERAAVAVAAGILGLVPWPELERTAPPK